MGTHSRRAVRLEGVEVEVGDDRGAMVAEGSLTAALSSHRAGASDVTLTVEAPRPSARDHTTEVRLDATEAARLRDQLDALLDGDR